MIVLAICRIGICEICRSQFMLEPEEIPNRCPACGTRMWLYGIESRLGRYIRQGHAFRDKVINPGVTSEKRQKWSHEQAAKRTPTNIRKRSKKIIERAKQKKREQEERNSQAASGGVGDQ